MFLLFLLKDPLEDVVETTSQSVTNTAAELLKQGAGNGLGLQTLAFNRHYDKAVMPLFVNTDNSVTLLQMRASILDHTFFLVLSLWTVGLSH